MPRDYQLQSRLGYKLSRLSKMMQARLEAGLAAHDLTRLKWCVLSGVEMEGHNAPSELADHIGITRPAISRLLKVMIKDGLIERRLVEADGRSREISITDLGRQKLETCWPMVEDNQAHFVDKLTTDQRHTLHDALHEMLKGEADAFEEL